MLSQMGNKSLQELTAPELQRFNQHLRWLPVSLDMLKQRRPTRELLYYRASVEEVLQSMEKIITDWTQNRTKTPLEWTAEQLLLAQVLDSVFEPRPAPTAIHLAAQRYWLQERQLTVLLLKSSPATSPGALLSLLQQRKIACDNVRVHAPELKEAWEQELSMNIQVLENMVAQPAKPRQEFTLPKLLLEAGVKPD